MCGTVARERKSLTPLNFYVNAWPFIHCLCFIYARTHVNITQQWKSTLRLFTGTQLLLHFIQSKYVHFQCLT